MSEPSQSRLSRGRAPPRATDRPTDRPTDRLGRRAIGADVGEDLSQCVPCALYANWGSHFRCCAYFSILEATQLERGVGDGLIPVGASPEDPEYCPLPPAPPPEWPPKWFVKKKGDDDDSDTSSAGDGDASGS